MQQCLSLSGPCIAEHGHSDPMKKPRPHRSPTPSPSPVRALDPHALSTVHGGDSIISPRDAASGLPTG